MQKKLQSSKAVVNELNLERKFVCEFCDHRYKNRIGLKHHMAMKHDVTLPFYGKISKKTSAPSPLATGLIEYLDTYPV